MRFLHSMIRVRDLDAALDFFVNKLGLRQVRRTDHEQGRFSLIFLETGAAGDSAQIELTYNWDQKEAYPGGRNFGHLAFEVDDIYAACQRLREGGVAILRPPRDGRMAFVRSPDQISVELLQKGAALAPAEPLDVHAQPGRVVTRALLAALVLLGFVYEVHAQEHASARLVYHVEGDASCPDEQAFRDIVVARLGYDPFHDASDTVVDASIGPRANSLVAQLRLYRTDDTPLGERDLGGAQGECWDLATSLAIAVTIALDPFASAQVEAAAPAPEATPAPAPAPAAAPPTAMDPPELRIRPRLDLGMTLHAALGVGFGVTPGPSIAPSIAAGLRIERFSVLVEGRVDAMPTARRLSSNDLVDAAAFAAGPTGCVRFGPGLACLGLEFGAFQGRGVDVSDSRTQSSFFSAGSARLGAGVPLGRTLSLALLGELRVPFVRTSLSIDGQTVWNAPPLAGGLRLALVASFL